MTFTWPSVWELVLLAAGAVAAALLLRLRLYRLDRAPQRPKVFSPLLGAGLMVGMLLLGPIGGQVVANFLNRPAAAAMSLEDQTAILLGVFAGQAIIVAVYLWLMLNTRRLGNDTRRRFPGAVALGVIGIVLFWPMAAAAGGIAAWLATMLRSDAIDPIAHVTLRLLTESDRDIWWWTLVLLVTTAGPVFEEVFYRGIIQETLRRVGMGPWTAIFAGSFVFAMMHVASVDPWALPALLVLSLGFGWAYERTGRLAAPIVMHIVFNAGNVALALLLS